MLGDSSNRKEMGRYFAIGQVGMEMVLPIAGGVAADYYLNTTPWGVILGAALGLCGGVVHLVYLTKPSANEQPPKDSPNDMRGSGPKTP